VTMKNILIIGATSAIAQHTARLYAQSGCRMFLVGRREEALKLLTDDLKARGAVDIDYLDVDLVRLEEHEKVIETAAGFLGNIDITLLAHGILGDQSEEERDFSKAMECLNVNCISYLSLLSILADVCEKQKNGTIAVVSSVAGDRGRQSNYIYGTAKGAVSIYLQGLRNRLYKHGVNVLTIKPGFVDTPMTSGFEKGMLWVGPERIARGIVKAVAKEKDVVYLPWFWQWIMLVIKLIPEPVFKRMNL